MIEYNSISQTVLVILTSIITGGFVLVFVEIGNRINRENNHFEMFMKPFIHKLSAYCRFISWCDGHICYPDKCNEKENEYRKLIDRIRLLGSRLILSGGDYPVDYFNATQLNEISCDINNIWYLYDKMKPCKLTWRDYSDGDSFITKELSEINPTYLSKPFSIDLISNLSGDFYAYTFQPIEYDIIKHEAFLKHYYRQNVFISIAVILVLLILSLMLFVQLPIIILQLSTITVVAMLLMSLLMLGVDMKKQIIWYNKFSLCLNGRYTKIRHFYNRNSQTK